MDQRLVLAERYEVCGYLGRGGMAEVLRARDLRLGRDVAVKVLRAGSAADAAFRARFRREALSAAALNHPAVVSLFDAGEAEVDGERVPFIVMEYVRGSTLERLARGGPDGSRPSPERALRLTASVLDALEHAHAAGIVHRDIKPANVMVVDGGSADAVKVMDFGIARPLGARGVTITAASMVVGTAEYLSPEQARGADLDARTDLYSTGCLLYELLTGRPPFTGDSPLEVAWKHVEEEPVPPSRYAPGVPAACDALVLRALRKDREERFPDAAAMRDAVREALTRPHHAPSHAPQDLPHGAPQDPPPATVVDRVAVEPPAPGRGGARRTLLVSSAVVVAAVAVAGAIGVHAMRGASGDGSADASGTGTVAGTVVAPDLRGQSLAQARRSARADRLRVGGVRAGACAGGTTQRTVCAQQPTPGSRVTPGTAVSLQVSPLLPRRG
ncbi:protein kinase [Streptantibioticus parmotrematis]|uniref:protein kinase domain-containing protein n=1 Tax=Streptantibioticus parmotrematis TaxID=2873249 RepID=UPI003402143A